MSGIAEPAGMADDPIPLEDESLATPVTEDLPPIVKSPLEQLDQPEFSDADLLSDQSPDEQPLTDFPQTTTLESDGRELKQEDSVSSPDGQVETSPLNAGLTAAGAMSENFGSQDCMDTVALETSPVSKNGEPVEEEKKEEDGEEKEKSGELTPSDNVSLSEGTGEGSQSQEGAEKVETEEHQSTASISSYFQDMSPGGSGDYFDSIPAPAEGLKESVSAPALSSTVEGPLETPSPEPPAVQRQNSGITTQETAHVPFEGAEPPSNITSIPATASTKNLSKFFTSDAGGSDIEGKSFFDSFTGSMEGSAMGPVPTSPLGSPRHEAPAAPGLTQTPPIPIQQLAQASQSPVPSPRHEPTMGGSAPTPAATHIMQSAILSTSSPLGSPAHVVPAAQQQVSPPPVLDGSTTPFSSVAAAEDPFSASMRMSDSDRAHDAWIPTELTQQALVTMATSAPGTYFPEQSLLTMPGIMIDDPQVDPVLGLVYRFMGEPEAQKRQTFTADSVSQDEAGLRQLIGAECYRSGVDLTGRLISALGQGNGKVNQVTRNTPQTLQLWFTRIALLMKLRLFSHAESEFQAFGNLDRPDLYYEFYQDTYPGRRGSIVPFAFRVLHAELPHHLGKSQEALDRLFYLHAIVSKIISNLDSGLAEDGSMIHLTDDSRTTSRELWESRRVHLMYSVGNVLLQIKDFQMAIEVFEGLVKADSKNSANLLCGIGRIYLQVGDIKMAQKYFNKGTAESDDSDPVIRCRNLMNKGFVALGQNAFSDAHEFFKEAVNEDPSNPVAVNNMAVCALYMDKLKDSLHKLEGLVHKDPATFLQEGILFNLCTLYELESSRAMAKKQALLELVNKHKGNGFNVACLKMA